MSETRIVKPQPPGGFPEWLPEEKLVEERCLRIIREEFERYGFTPIETPAVERREVLTAKGIESKEIYGLERLAAGEGEDKATEMALHFDLTVPLARYVAQHFQRLTFPFRRYQIQKVWRGERPQAGRFREFYQCDIDIVGNGSLSPLNDAEIPCVIHAIFSRIGVGPFRVRLNNRKVLQGLIEAFGCSGERYQAALRAIDAIEKVGRDRTIATLAGEAAMERGRAEALLDRLTNEATVADLRRVEGGELLARGLDELEAVTGALDALGMPRDGWALDLKIARGLDYYTGTVYETGLLDRPEIGSVCSGGRYDELASSFTRQSLPGVGISIGLTRLLARLFEAGVLKPGRQTAATTLVTVMAPALLAQSLEIAGELRRAGVPTEVYLEPKKLGDQLRYADKKGFRAAVILGDEEIRDGVVMLKDLGTGAQHRLSRAELAATIAGLTRQAAQ